MSTGQNLQAPVYAAGAGGEGRFAFLRPELEPDLFVHATTAEDAEMQDDEQAVKWLSKAAREVRTRPGKSWTSD